MEWYLFMYRTYKNGDWELDGNMPSGNLLHSYWLLNMAHRNSWFTELKDGDVPVRWKRLPEGRLAGEHKIALEFMVNIWFGFTNKQNLLLRHRPYKKILDTDGFRFRLAQQFLLHCWILAGCSITKSHPMGPVLHKGTLLGRPNPRRLEPCWNSAVAFGGRRRWSLVVAGWGPISYPTQWTNYHTNSHKMEGTVKIDG